VADDEAQAEVAEETEPVAVVDVEQSADEPEEMVEAAGDEPAVIADEPELGLSDDVFPAGAEADESGASDDEPADTPADEA